MVDGLVGVNTSVRTVVWPFTTVVYVYGVGPPGVPVVDAGWPTGPCCNAAVVVAVVAVLAVAVVVAVVDVVVAVVVRVWLQWVRRACNERVR